jgi:flagellar motor switch protein FliG
MPQVSQKISGLRKAAMLMVLLGEKTASAIYRNLPQHKVELLTREIASLEYVPNDTAAQISEEFNKLLLTREYVLKGGIAYAQSLLVQAFGESMAKDLLLQVTRTEEVSVKDLETLQKADPQQLLKFVEGEHPQTVALLLAHLGANTASTLVQLLPQETKSQVVERLAKIRQFSPEMVQKIVTVVTKKIKGLGKQKLLTYGGIDAVADLLNRMDVNASKTILESIETADANLAQAIRNVMFTFEDFLVAPDASVRELLGALDKKTLAVALKGASPMLKEKFLGGMSDRAAEMFKEDMEVTGAVRARDVARAQVEIVTMARKLEAEGKITLKNEGEDALVA